jgi:hypothetical protein
MTFTENSIRLSQLNDKINNQHYNENESYDILKQEFNKVYDVLQNSISEKKYFSGTTLELYIVELRENCQLEKDESIDFNEIEYLKTEYRFINTFLNQRLRNSTDPYPYYLSKLNNENYKLFRSIIMKRIDYIEKLLFSKGIEVIIKPSDKNHNLDRISFKKHLNIMIENDNQQIDIIPQIDLSDSTSAVKKIIYLNELGIINFLRLQPCFTSNNSLANVLTAITGEKQTTLQPLVNALINDSGHEKHKPYKSIATVSKVKKQLTDLGFKP